ncbi:PIR Superfamily Protein [Plasmodium ovale curtisi]|uniref:PIR Superfamily Protein n=1 Tax=Plasmodium ovale curtisi TaxID=864141 RepID=A0A1A8X1S5_PLAOA|nr:PIR Superfamily Protein [Plasmodium ovale curtisi]
MGVEVAFSRDSQRKSCMDEFNDIDSNDDKKIEDVKQTDEEDGTFLQKCHDLRNYLETYNEKYKHCFKGEAAAFFLFNRDLIYKALVKCTNYEKRLTELELLKEKQVATADELGEPNAEKEGSTKRTLLGEQTSEAVTDCKNTKCNSKEMEDQTQPEREGMHNGESESRKEQETSVSLQELATVTKSLSNDQELLGNKAHSSGSHSQEDPTLIESSNLDSPKSVEGVTQPDDYLQGPDKPSHSSSTTLIQHPVDQVDEANPNSKGSDADLLSSETSGKEITPGQSHHVAGLPSARSSLPDESVSSTGTPLTTSGVSSPGLSLPFGESSFFDETLSAVTPLPVKESPLDERISSSTHQLSDGVTLSASQHSLASQQLTTEGQSISEIQVSDQTESPVRILLLPHNCGPDKIPCDVHLKSSQQDLHNTNLTNHHSDKQSTFERRDTSEASIEPGENNLSKGGIKSSTSHAVSEGISIKTYIIIILVVLAIILLSILLLKYACLRGYFSKKRRKKRQRIQEELDRIMHSPSIFSENNMYLSYTCLENSYYNNANKNYT